MLVCVGHMSRDCEKRLTCQVCSQAVLHIKRQTTGLEQVKEPSDSLSTSFKTCGHTGAGKDQCVLSILPVKVKAAKGSHVIKTYAVLDPGSSGTFCSKHAEAEYHRKENKLPSPHNGADYSESSIYSLVGLEVSDMDSNEFYALPEVITQKKMPVTAADMVTPEDLANWPYLSRVHIPSIKANVDL